MLALEMWLYRISFALGIFGFGIVFTHFICWCVHCMAMLLTNNNVQFYATAKKIKTICTIFSNEL